MFGWLVREEVLLAGLCKRKLLFRLKIYDRLRQATAKRTEADCGCVREKKEKEKKRSKALLSPSAVNKYNLRSGHKKKR